MLLRKKYFREIAILNRFLGRLGPQILHEDFLQDLPMVCFVVTQHSESELSLCLRYSKTSSLQATKKHPRITRTTRNHGTSSPGLEAQRLPQPRATPCGHNKTFYNRPVRTKVKSVRLKHPCATLRGFTYHTSFIIQLMVIKTAKATNNNMYIIYI